MCSLFLPWQSHSTLDHSSFILNTFRLPKMIKWRLARVRATFTRGWLSINWLSLDRTVDSIMTSFSPPWNASTVDIWILFMAAAVSEAVLIPRCSESLSACSLSDGFGVSRKGHLMCHSTCYLHREITPRSWEEMSNEIMVCNMCEAMAISVSFQ